MLRLRFERTHRHLSQQGVALLARLPQQQVSLIELGRYQPSPAQLQRLAAVFKVAPDDLLKDVAMIGPR